MIPHDAGCLCSSCGTERRLLRLRHDVRGWWRVMRDFGTWSEAHGEWCDCWTCVQHHRDNILMLSTKFDRFPMVTVPEWLKHSSLRTMRKHQWSRRKAMTTPCACADCHRVIKFHYESGLDQRFIEHTLTKQKEERERMTQESKVQESTKQSIEVEIAGKKYTVHVAVSAEAVVQVEQVKEKVNITTYLLETFNSDHVHNSVLYSNKNVAVNEGERVHDGHGYGFYVTEVQVPEELYEDDDWRVQSKRLRFVKDLVKAGSGKVVGSAPWAGPKVGAKVEVSGLEVEISKVQKTQPSGMYYDVTLSHKGVTSGSVRVPVPTWTTLSRS